MIVDLESSHLGLLITPNPAFASEETTFNVTITSGGPGSPRLAGKTITLDYGEAYMSDTTSSSANGVATFTHTYCRFGDVTATATFAGAPPLAMEYTLSTHRFVLSKAGGSYTGRSAKHCVAMRTTYLRYGPQATALL